MRTYFGMSLLYEFRVALLLEIFGALGEAIVGGLESTMTSLIGRKSVMGR